MKRVLCMTFLSALLALLPGCSGKKAPEVVLTKKPRGKVLIVCYSQSGTKNTLTVAKWIREKVGGELFEIVMEKPYSDSYAKVLIESKKHMDGKILPPIKPFKGKIAEYDLIFVGSPVWYNTFAPPLGTFLNQHDFAGKTILPFCTHGGGGPGHLYADIKAALPKARVLEGLTLKGHNIIERTFGRGTADKCSPAEVTEWLNRVL